VEELGVEVGGEGEEGIDHPLGEGVGEQVQALFLLAQLASFKDAWGWGGWVG
jgi:hypothetical protein